MRFKCKATGLAPTNKGEHAKAKAIHQYEAQIHRGQRPVTRAVDIKEQWLKTMRLNASSAKQNKDVTDRFNILAHDIRQTKPLININDC